MTHRLTLVVAVSICLCWGLPAVAQEDAAAGSSADTPAPLAPGEAFTGEPSQNGSLMDLSQVRADIKSGDYAAALTLLRQPAESGDAAAEEEMGVLYYWGFGVATDFGAAMGWFRKAAAQGYGNAESMIGMMYQESHGVPQDLSEAQLWFQKAADHGSAVGQYNLGNLYASGWDANGWAPNKKDYVKAMFWFRKAAAQGFFFADYMIALQYQNGQGVAADETAAQAWMTKAADLGLPLAKQWLAQHPQ